MDGLYKGIIMKASETKLNEIKLVGVTARTSNKLEANPDTAKIGQTLGNYFANNLSQKITNRAKPGVTYCVYTKYDSDEHGAYTYFVGEEVDSFTDVDPTFEQLTIPSSAYTKFECGPGEMPMVCIDAWKKIWQMQEADLGGKRSYLADFEVYDERAQDYSSAVLDIYIGIKKHYN